MPLTHLGVAHTESQKRSSGDNREHRQRGWQRAIRQQKSARLEERKAKTYLPPKGALHEQRTGLSYPSQPSARANISLAPCWVRLHFEPAARPR